ncbi:MAG: thiol-disulfide oxidoreductase DCC family protein [Phycisphaerae bacterium]
MDQPSTSPTPSRERFGVAPTNGWTGGQYSLWRFLAGGVIASAYLDLLLPEADAFTWMVAGPGVVAACLMAFGYADRIAGAFAGALAVPTAYWSIADPGYDTAMLFVLAIGLLHAVMPRGPFGSASAINRPDPGGGWRLPALQLTLVRLVAAAGAVILAVMITRGSYDVLAGLGWVVLLLLAVDPAWLGRNRQTPGGRIFYDGYCGLCHGFVRFVLAEDRRGLFTLSPRQSGAFERHLSAADRDAAGDTVVVQDVAGGIHTRSAAAIKVLLDLGGWWRLLGGLLMVIPRPLRDAAYDGVARARLKLFGTRKDACPMMPPELRDRFVMD